MRFFLNKRANSQELLYGSVFPLLIGCVIILILLSYISAVSQSTYFEREFLVKDIGLLVEALQASPYNAQVNYPEDNSKLAKELKIILTKDAVQASPYNVNSILTPSKSSVFIFLASNLTVKESVATPKVEKDSNGKNFTYPYRLYFLKNSDDISMSSNNLNVPLVDDRSQYIRLISTVISDWYDSPRVYIDSLQKPGSDEVKYMDGICQTLRAQGRGGVYTANECHFIDSVSDDERRTKAKTADLIVLFYLNNNKLSKETVDVYYLSGSSDVELKSQKLAGLSLIDLQYSYNDTKKKRLEGDLKTRVENIAGDKPVIIIEIGNLESLKIKDSEKIGKSVYRAINYYYTT